jgi:hypothetical protein
MPERTLLFDTTIAHNHDFIEGKPIRPICIVAA